LHLAKACFENWREKKDIQHDLWNKGIKTKLEIIF
jgi:hypothetical protein